MLLRNWSLALGGVPTSSGYEIQSWPATTAQEAEKEGRDGKGEEGEGKVATEDIG